MPQKISCHFDHARRFYIAYLLNLTPYDGHRVSFYAVYIGNATDKMKYKILAIRDAIIGMKNLLQGGNILWMPFVHLS